MILIRRSICKKYKALYFKKAKPKLISSNVFILTHYNNPNIQKRHVSFVNLNVNEKGEPEIRNTIFPEVNEVFYSTRAIKPTGCFAISSIPDGKMQINRPDLSSESTTYIHEKVKEIIKNYHRRDYNKSDKCLVELLSNIIPLNENYKNIASNTKLFYLMYKYFSQLEEDEIQGHLKLSSHYIYTRGSYRLRTINDVQQYLLRIYSLNSISDGLQDILKLMELTQTELNKESVNYLLIYNIRNGYETKVVNLINDILNNPKLYELPMLTFENTLKFLSESDSSHTLKTAAKFYKIVQNPSEKLIELEAIIHSKLDNFDNKT